MIPTVVRFLESGQRRRGDANENGKITAKETDTDGKNGTTETRKKLCYLFGVDNIGQ